MFALLKVKKHIFKTILILILVNKKGFWKKHAVLSLSSIQKLAKIILNILKIKQSVFWALTLIKQTFIFSLVV